MRNRPRRNFSGTSPQEVFTKLCPHIIPTRPQSLPATENKPAGQIVLSNERFNKWSVTTFEGEPARARTQLASGRDDHAAVLARSSHKGDVFGVQMVRACCGSCAHHVYINTREAGVVRSNNAGLSAARGQSRNVVHRAGPVARMCVYTILTARGITGAAVSTLRRDSKANDRACRVPRKSFRTDHYCCWLAAPLKEQRGIDARAVNDRYNEITSSEMLLYSKCLMVPNAEYEKLIIPAFNEVLFVTKPTSCPLDFVIRVYCCNTLGLF